MISRKDKNFIKELRKSAESKTGSPAPKAQFPNYMGED